mmetsp:Transcript_28059/g.46027  ORF Transcript_28059/g.46027 Transcript_28059/m.46027 type:complete len:218 (+) Transcript_28059:119-772(+)
MASPMSSGHDDILHQHLSNISKDFLNLLILAILKLVATISQKFFPRGDVHFNFNFTQELLHLVLTPHPNRTTFGAFWGLVGNLSLCLILHEHLDDSLHHGVHLFLVITLLELHFFHQKLFSGAFWNLPFQLILPESFRTSFFIPEPNSTAHITSRLSCQRQGFGQKCVVLIAHLAQHFLQVLVLHLADHLLQFCGRHLALPQRTTRGFASSVGERNS